MEKILESSEDFDVELFDRVVAVFYTPGHPEQKRAEKVLALFRYHPDSWARTSAILRESREVKSKIFSLQVLEKMVKMRWSVLTEEQKEGVREYIVESILEHSVESRGEKEERKEERSKKETVLKGMNQILIEIIKREWPEKWPTLIPDLLAASNGDSRVCKNTFNILDDLCNDIFNFPKTMVAARAKALQEQMRREFAEIFRLVYSILEKVSVGEVSVPGELVVASMEILRRILPHLEMGYVLQTNISEIVCRYVDTAFNAEAIEVLKEVLEKEPQESEREAFHEVVRGVFVNMSAFIEKYLREFESAHRGKLKEHYSRMTEKNAATVKKMVLFFSRAYDYSKQLEALSANTVGPLHSLLEISKVGEFEIFRLCTEFWHKFVKELFSEFPFSPAPSKQPPGLRRARYGGVLVELAKVLVAQMPRPEEVLITENEDGEVVLERLSETEYITNYTEVKETLFNIASIISGGLSAFLLSEAQQLFGTGWSRERANKIAWATGAISESMGPSEEKEFLIHIFGAFLKLCESKREAGDRAIVASCIMYVISQNPRFLQSYWGFLSVTTTKIFEFMRETQEGVPEMACEVFLTIMSKCGKEMGVVHEKEKRPMVEEILEKLPETIEPLKGRPYLVERVYEGMCHMVGNRVGELLKCSLSEIYSPVLDVKEGVQECTRSVRKIKVVASAKVGGEFARAREAAIEEIYPQLQKIHEKLAGTRHHMPQVQKSVEILKKEVVDVFIVVADNFSIGFIHRNFINVCSQIVLHPLTSGSGGGFVPEGLDLLAALCRRTVQGTLPLVEQMAEPVSKVVMSDPVSNENLMKSFFNMICTSVKVHNRPSTIEVIEWIAFGAGQSHRDVSEKCIEAIAHVLNRGSIEIIRVGFFGLLECIVGASLDKDHEGGKDALIESLSTLTRYSIEGKCPTQSEVTSIFGGRLQTIFAHLTHEDVQEFIDRCYAGVNSHDALADNIDDFRVKIRTI